MIITNAEGELSVKSLKSAVARFKILADRWDGTKPALFVCPELKLKARELLHGGEMKWMVLYSPATTDFWFVGSEELTGLLEKEAGAPRPYINPPRSEVNAY